MHENGTLHAMVAQIVCAQEHHGVVSIMGNVVQMFFNIKLVLPNIRAKPNGPIGTSHFNEELSSLWETYNREVTLKGVF